MQRKLIKDRIKHYEKNKKLIESKAYNYVPFYGFDKLKKYVPGVVPGVLYKVTSHMGVGKTQLAKFLFVYQTMLYAIKNKINFKVLYFALEESKEEFLDSLFIHLSKRIHKANINRFALTGFSDTPVTADHMKAIKGVEVAMANLMSNIEIIDYIYEPSKMFKECKKYANKWGKFEKDAAGNDTKYIPNDPAQITLVVTDHISLLDSEFNEKMNGYMSERQAIAKWHTHYCRRVLAKQWNWAILNIQQQTLDSEKQQFTSKGTSIVNKVLPTLDGLANNKEVGRDDYVSLGLFAPARYDFEDFRGYDINNNTPKSFGDRFRSIHLLKNRFGEPNKILPLYFDGRYTYFKELPLPTDPGIGYFYKLLKT